MKKRKRTKAKGPNMLFPGLPGYHGPQRGWFAWVHHGRLFEKASEPIRNRVGFVKRNKPKSERRIRLAHIMYLGAYLSRKLTRLQEGWFTDLSSNPDAMRAVQAYIKKHKPRNKWNAHRGTLVKADGTSMTGTGI